MSRRSDRELPSPPSSLRAWSRTFPLFLVLLTASSLAIFNYQKTNSPVVAATLYALRMNPKARDVLGDEIYFGSQIPWIWGELNQVQGRVDIRFNVKGKNGKGVMRFRSIRKTSMSYFETQEWSLQTEDGRVIQLADEGEDPFKNMGLQAEAET